MTEEGPRAGGWFGRVAALGLLAGCAAGAPPSEAPVRPRDMPAPEAGRGAPIAGETAAELDTTSASERAAAAGGPAAEGERKLGTTVATLGDPGEPGFWARTPLVEEVRDGRLVDPASGASVQVELRPSAKASGGSQISLPALRVLGVALTDLPELAVYAG